MCCSIAAGGLSMRSDLLKLILDNILMKNALEDNLLMCYGDTFNLCVHSFK